MFKLYPALKNKTYVNLLAGLFLVLIGAAFMVQTYPVVWIVVALGLFLLAPVLVDFCLIFCVIAAIFIDAPIDMVKPGWVNKGMTFVETFKRTGVLHLHLLFAKLPLGKYNLLALGLASTLVEYANVLGVQSVPLDYNALVCCPMIPFYQQAAQILELNKFAARGDLVLVYVLLSRHLYLAGNTALALGYQQKAVHLYEQMSEKELKDFTENIVLLAENLIFTKQTESDLAEKIGKHALVLIETSPVGTTGKQQLLLLVNAINTLAEIYKSRNQGEEANNLTTRSEILTAALKTRGVAV